MKRPCESRSGFTLLELLAVIGIIAIMSVVVTGSFTNIGRAMAASNSVSAVQRTLMLARQASCVDGVDMYVWVTDVNKFVTCRYAGTVSKDLSTNSSLKRKSTGDSLDSSRNKWVIDQYADLSNAREKFGMIKDEDEKLDQSDDAAFKSAVSEYDGLLVFDLDDGILAKVTETPFYDAGQDAWVFAVKSSSGFTKGHSYGWVTGPEQTLPKGFVFPDAVGSDGYFNKADIYVHFDSFGNAEAETIKILEVATGKESEVKVDAAGKVTIKEATK